MTTPNAPDIPAGPVDTEPVGSHDSEQQAAVLLDPLHAAGVELGAYDRVVLYWLAWRDWSTLSVIASWMARATQAREAAPTVALPSRFDATPAEVDRHLRRILAEDTYLRYQQTIGGLAVSEAARDLRMEVVLPGTPDAKAWRQAADFFDPLNGGGRYPSQLQCSQHNGFGPCPGAPRCTPRDGEREKDTSGGHQPLEGESTPDFFQRGRTYTRQYHGDVNEFRVDHIATAPDSDHRRAYGWYRRDAGARWHGYFADESEFDGWTEATEDGA
ncbi:hypothetical protein ABZ468_25785 [Streptomyces sp. NPDC005708]|uniref:hypothetical protein n=1 Tax=Streptomyces sp. NPDC005708 TaxID=3154564 RepID=UPI0034023AAE